jgi:hypothetical protein
MSETLIPVELQAIAVAASPLERTSLLAFLVTTGQSYTLTELTEQVPRFVVEQGGAEKLIELSTGKVSWLIATLVAAKLVEIKEKKYSATVTGTYLYANIIQDAFENALRPEEDAVLSKIVVRAKGDRGQEAAHSPVSP